MNSIDPTGPSCITDPIRASLSQNSSHREGEVLSYQSDSIHRTATGSSIDHTKWNSLPTENLEMIFARIANEKAREIFSQKRRKVATLHAALRNSIPGIQDELERSEMIKYLADNLPQYSHEAITAYNDLRRHADTISDAGARAHAAQALDAQVGHLEAICARHDPFLTIDQTIAFLKVLKNSEDPHFKQVVLQPE